MNETIDHSSLMNERNKARFVLFVRPINYIQELNFLFQNVHPVLLYRHEHAFRSSSKWMWCLLELIPPMPFLDWLNWLVLERACLLLQDPPNRKVHRVEIRQIRRPNILPPETGKVRLTPLTSRLRSMGRGPVLPKPLVHVFCMSFSPWNDGDLQDQLVVDLGIGFCPFQHKNKLGFSKSWNSGPDHDAFGEMGFSTLTVCEEPLGKSSRFFWKLQTGLMVKIFSSVKRIRLRASLRLSCFIQRHFSSRGLHFTREHLGFRWFAHRDLQ